MKIANYKKAVLTVLDEKFRSKLESTDERSKGFTYEITADIELISNILSEAEKTTEDMGERLYKGIQYSLTKSFKAVCLQKDILGETKAYSSGRKDAVALCKQICKRTWSMKGNGEI